MGFPVGHSGLTWVGGVPVVGRGIECLSHVILHGKDNVRNIPGFHFVPWPVPQGPRDRKNRPLIWEDR